MSSTPSLSSGTPGYKALQTMQSLNKDMVFKIPQKPVGRSRKTKVLDEETYIEEMGKIIERDFFPDLERLQAQNDYLDAVERNDRQRVREICVKYSGIRPPTERVASPATFETPLHESRNTPRVPPPSEFGTPKTTTSEDQPKKPIQTSLDQYLATHTSEDNKSFSEIMEESEKWHRTKYSYLYNKETETGIEQATQLALPSIEDQAEIKDRPFNIDTWHYKNKNFIMYVPEGVDPTKQELIEMSKKNKEVVHSNTRLQVNPFDEQQSKETISELAKSQAKILDGRIGVDGKELTNETPNIGGFSLVRTPSPCPGVLESPLMTWGQIEGTPFKLDGSDTPIVQSQGPSFKIADLPKREKLALALAEKAGERHRDRKMKAIQAARRQLATPSPSPSSLRRLESMSPAARRLATARLGDIALRASYSPSPLMRRKGTPATPLVHRPSTPRTPKVIGANKNLTDNLLHISVAKRAQASDFF